MSNFNLETVPTYVKNSELYKKLVLKKITFVSSEVYINKKTFSINQFPSEILTFDDFKQMCSIILFWDIKPPYPISFYMYIYNDLSEVKIYIKKYDNFLTKHLLETELLHYSFFTKIMSIENNYNLLNYCINNNIETPTMLCLDFCGYDNINLFKYVCTHYNSLIDYKLVWQSVVDRVNLNFIKFIVETKGSYIIHTENNRAIIISSQLGKLDCVKYLVETGGKEQIHTKNDRPLIDAAKNKHDDVVIYLIENGANIYSNDNKIFAYYGYAGNLNMIKYLTKICNSDDAFFTALDNAAYTSKINVIKYLIETVGSYIIYLHNNEVIMRTMNGQNRDMIEYIHKIMVKDGKSFNPF